MSAKPESEIQYGWLPPEMWHMVEGELTSRGTALPEPLTGAGILVAHRGGRILGFQIRQLLWHVEPLILMPEAQGSDVWRGLASRMDESFKAEAPTAFYSFCDDERTRHMLEEFGCEEIPGRSVFIKQVKE